MKCQNKFNNFYIYENTADFFIPSYPQPFLINSFHGYLITSFPEIRLHPLLMIGRPDIFYCC
jgi:hypothetical protein